MFQRFSLSPLFLGGYLVRRSELSPRQWSSVPVQHAVTQRLQVTAARRSWKTGMVEAAIYIYMYKNRFQVCASPCFVFVFARRSVGRVLWCCFVYNCLYDEVMFNLMILRLKRTRWTTEATHLLLCVHPGWWTQQCPHVAFCWLHGIPHAFLRDSTWRHGSILQGTPEHTHTCTQKQPA